MLSPHYTPIWYHQKPLWCQGCAEGGYIILCEDDFLKWSLMGHSQQTKNFLDTKLLPHYTPFYTTRSLYDVKAMQKEAVLSYVKVILINDL